MYSKSPMLLASMAMRFDHSFGLLSDASKEYLIDSMSIIYDDLATNPNLDAIAEKHKISTVTISQLKEEVDGNGFFQE